jgi:hypothetical protein
MRAGGASENQIFPYLGPEKYAMNVVVRGEEISRVFLAPTQVGLDIVRAWEEQMYDAEPSVNIFDPKASTAWTVTRSKEAGKTRYLVVAV